MMLTGDNQRFRTECRLREPAQARLEALYRFAEDQWLAGATPYVDGKIHFIFRGQEYTTSMEAGVVRVDLCPRNHWQARRRANRFMWRRYA